MSDYELEFSRDLAEANEPAGPKSGMVERALFTPEAAQSPSYETHCTVNTGKRIYPFTQLFSNEVRALFSQKIQTYRASLSTREYTETRSSIANKHQRTNSVFLKFSVLWSVNTLTLHHSDYLLNMS